MNIQPTLEIHPHQEFHFAENTDSCGCCGFWKSKAKPEGFYVDSKDQIVPMKNTTKLVAARMKANLRLARLVESRFENDHIDNNKAFNLLRSRVNHNFEGCDVITEERMIDIVNAIYEIRKDVKD